MKVDKDGELKCKRIDCKSVACDQYIDSVGYICNECKEEFRIYAANYGESSETKAQFISMAVAFIATTKGTYINDAKINIDQFFNSCKGKGKD